MWRKRTIPNLQDKNGAKPGEKQVWLALNLFQTSSTFGTGSSGNEPESVVQLKPKWWYSLDRNIKKTKKAVRKRIQSPSQNPKMKKQRIYFYP